MLVQHLDFMKVLRESNGAVITAAGLTEGNAGGGIEVGDDEALDIMG